jgi:hypothetical protein
MRLKVEKKSQKNLSTLWSTPKRCNACKNELTDRSALMMGVSWECESCDKRWCDDMMRIV